MMRDVMQNYFGTGRLCGGACKALLCALSLHAGGEVAAVHGSPPERFSPPPLALKTEDGFSVPQTGHVFSFPRDHGSHPDFKVEWWYVTGHLFGPSKERFGVQATFFRRAQGRRSIADAGVSSGAQVSPDVKGSEVARFRSDEIYLFHAALLEVSTGRFIHSERLARAGWDAGAETEWLSVRVRGASLKSTSPQGNQSALRASIRDGAAFDLLLDPLKPLVIFGKDGVSRKGDSPTAASWYLTFPRMKAGGELFLEGKTVPVQGEVWMDHEISSSQLTGEQAGWDWAGIQFEDGREIMVYRLRRKDGSTDPASALTWVDKAGVTTEFGAAEFDWDASGKWKSPRSGAEYPLPVRLKAVDPATGRQEQWTLQPLAADQELDGSVSKVPYWEGACRVLKDGKPVGSAYVELTGYAGALGRALR